MTLLVKNIFIVLLIACIVLLFDDLFLTVDIHTYLAFHIWSSSFMLTASYVVVIISVEFISIALLLSNKYIAIPLLVLYICVWILELNYKLIGGDGFNVNEVLNIFHNPAFILDGIKSFFSINALILSFGIILFGILIYKLLKKFVYKKVSFVVSLSLFLCLFIIDLFVYNRLHKFAHYPSNLKIIHSLYVNIFLREPTKARQAPEKINLSHKPLAKNIILIVDESIRSDILQLNGFKKKTTPFLLQNAHKLINFGLVVSSTTQSNESNMIIRTGVPLNSLPDLTLSNESNMPLVYFAKKANFYTTILDSQSNGIVNGIRDEDKKYIDSIISYKELHCTKPYRDTLMIDKIIETLNNKKNNFIYFNKYGAHFNYDDTYPTSETYFTPTLEDSNPHYSEKEKRLNSYYNAIRWSVDTFWKKLLLKLKNRDVIVVYVSDHGQSLMEDLNYKRTHAGDKKEQAMVPLWVYAPTTIKSMLYKKYGVNIEKNKNRLTHFEIFPTILKFLGIKTTKTTIFDIIPSRKRYFFSPEGGTGRLKLLKKHTFEEVFND